MLLILLNYFEQLPSTTIFKTTEHCYNLRSIFERFTPRVSKALLDFNTMMGSDQTGSFHGHTKQSYWNTFLKSTIDTLDAFIHLRISHKTRYWFFIFRTFRCCSLLYEQSPTGCEESFTTLMVVIFLCFLSDIYKLLCHPRLEHYMKRFCVNTTQLCNWSSTYAITPAAWFRTACLEMGNCNATARCCHDKIASTRIYHWTNCFWQQNWLQY